MILHLLFPIVLLSYLINTSAQVFPLAKPGCQSRCGDVDIPFPFGIGSGCAIDDWFQLNCINSSKPFFTNFNMRLELEVLEISVEVGTVTVNHPVFRSCNTETASINVNFEESPFVFSQVSNRFTGVGCNNLAFMSSLDSSIVGGCFSSCGESSNTVNQSNCYGIKCCQTRIPSFLKIFNATIGRINYNNNGENRQQEGCKYAFLVEQQWFENKLLFPEDIKNFTNVPVKLEWFGIFNYSFNLFAMNKSTNYNSTSGCISSAIRNVSVFSTVRCKCFDGFQGNPYLLDGCQDIDECSGPNRCGSDMLCMNRIGGYTCFYSATPGSRKPINMILLGIGVGLVGLFLLSVGTWWLWMKIKKRKEIKLKEKYFRKNGGLLLQQQLTSFDGNVDNSKLFNSKELDKATDHFNANRILGQGGQGTVYKGMLVDGRIVAVKKSKVVDKGKLEEFINEVVIVSQINHRNVVKLLGFCLETEFPLLVYEYIPNGTLFQYLHDQNEELPLTWEKRLQIATEVAGALSYLHSAAAIPIYHRDIKSTNILLDEKFRAKVADFGTSKSISIDQTHVTTKVQGTFGYLDPEYFQSSQFTDKSDVYSFGVVLVELLTGEKAIFSTSSQEARGLASYFVLSMEENNLFDILNAQVMKMGKREEIIAIANLAKRCLNLNGKKRPTMKEVAMELEGIQASRKESANVHQIYDEIEYKITETIEPWDVVSTSTGSTFDSIITPSVEVQPLLVNRTL